MKMTVKELVVKLHCVPFVADKAKLPELLKSLREEGWRESEPLQVGTGWRPDFWQTIEEGNHRLAALMLAGEHDFEVPVKVLGAPVSMLA